MIIELSKKNGSSKCAIFPPDVFNIELTFNQMKSQKSKSNTDHAFGNKIVAFKCACNMPNKA